MEESGFESGKLDSEVRPHKSVLAHLLGIFTEFYVMVLEIMLSATMYWTLRGCGKCSGNHVD